MLSPYVVQDQPCGSRLCNAVKLPLPHRCASRLCCDRPESEGTTTSGAMGHSHRGRVSLPYASSRRQWRLSRRPRVRGPTATFQTPAALSVRPTSSPAHVLETWPPGRCQRLPPVALPSRTATRSGEARGGRVWGLCRGGGGSTGGGCVAGERLRRPLMVARG